MDMETQSLLSMARPPRQLSTNDAVASETKSTRRQAFALLFAGVLVTVGAVASTSTTKTHKPPHSLNLKLAQAAVADTAVHPQV